MTTHFDRIAIDPAVMNGQPCIRNLRLTVRRVVEAVALYPDWNDLRAEYPELEDADFHAIIAVENASGSPPKGAKTLMGDPKGVSRPQRKFQ